MATATPEKAISELENSDNVLDWANSTLSSTHDLADLQHTVTQLLDSLDFASDSTSAQVERIIDDVSRSIPRLTYDLHFMTDGAISLQTAISTVLQRSQHAIPQTTASTLTQLRELDTVKRNMESARDVLREAESWSTLEMEVTGLLAEAKHGQAAGRLLEASRSMAVFQNTPEYEPRRALMFNLQNQLEASMSSALVAAINEQDLASCRAYLIIFRNIQREAEFRSYYYGSKREPILEMWRTASLSDCNTPPSESPQTTFNAFLPAFYDKFHDVLSQEKFAIPVIFPDPKVTLVALMSSAFAGLQPSFAERLNDMVNYQEDSALNSIITAFHTAEEFSSGMRKVMQNLQVASLAAASPREGDGTTPTLGRRRSVRMSMSWRSGQTNTAGPAEDNYEWEQEIFQPFLDFQVEYGALESRRLDLELRKIVGYDGLPTSNQSRILKEWSGDVLNAAEASLSRCVALTYGYGSVGLLQAIDSMLKTFISLWAPENASDSRSGLHGSPSGEDLFDLDYSSQDWADIQNLMGLLASSKVVSERLVAFEARLGSNLAQIATKFRLAREDPATHPLSPARGATSLLEQSTLNSSELNTLFDRMENTGAVQSAENSSATSTNKVLPTLPLLPEAHDSLSSFAKACQERLLRVILVPLRKHFSAYHVLPSWSTGGDPKARHTTTANALQVPTFSLSPSDPMQRVAEGLLNLPRLFEVYANDDGLSYSLHTLPHVNAELLRSSTDHVPSTPSDVSRSPLRRRSSSGKPAPLDPEAVSSAWLSSLSRTLLKHLTAEVLPRIKTLSLPGAAQLASDLGYLTNIVSALNGEDEALDRWKLYAEMDQAAGVEAWKQNGESEPVLQHVARMRGWTTA